MTWFTDRRTEWIGETLRVFGYINREHIMRKFDVSPAQAAIDLRTFRSLNPGSMTYNSSLKRYEAVHEQARAQ